MNANMKKPGLRMKEQHNTQQHLSQLANGKLLAVKSLYAYGLIFFQENFLVMKLRIVWKLIRPAYSTSALDLISVCCKIICIAIEKTSDLVNQKIQIQNIEYIEYIIQNIDIDRIQKQSVRFGDIHKWNKQPCLIFHSF